MVVGYHLVWTAYGWWLPNDLRGSSSHVICSDIIAQLGELHHGRKKIQPASSEIAAFYAKAREVLKHQLLKFNALELAAMGRAFGEAIRHENYTCYACALMPDHMHVVIRKHRDQAEDMIAKLQAASRDAVLAVGLREAEHPVWGGPGWKVFLEDRGDFERTIKYVENNPLKEGRPQQYWDFVTQYDGWMPGIVTRAKPDLRNRKRYGRS